MTLRELKDSPAAIVNADVIRQIEGSEKSKKPAKYGNSKTEVDGIVFDSIKEANRYQELKLQQEYELNPGGTHSLKYVSDFEYLISATGEKVVEDVKGFRTREYKKKRRLMKKVHGIVIKEV